MNDLCGSLPGNGPVNLVLNRFKKKKTDFLCGVIVEAGGVDVRDFLVEPPLGGPDILNSAHQLFEIVEGLIRIFQAFVIENESLDDIFLQSLGGPNPELSAPVGLHAVTN